MMRSPAPRGGYTLLEMTLALAIAIMILGAVYELLNRQITNAEIGRNITEESSLARVLLDRMATDIEASLGGVDPQQTSSTGSDPTQSAVDPSALTSFNLGISGTDSVLILSSSRVPRELVAYDKLKVDSSQLAPVSDIRRISYWFSGDGSNSGLARQEVVTATGTDLDTMPPDVPNASALVVAPEVKGVTFEYFDGTDWQSSWDGTTPAVDGVTPIGPPAAVRITLTLKSRDGQRTTEYKHTVALPAGNNFLAQKLGF